MMVVVVKDDGSVVVTGAGMCVSAHVIRQPRPTNIGLTSPPSIGPTSPTTTGPTLTATIGSTSPTTTGPSLTATIGTTSPTILREVDGGKTNNLPSALVGQSCAPQTNANPMKNRSTKVGLIRTCVAFIL